MLKHKIGLVIAALTVSGLAAASSGVQWQVKENGEPVEYNPNGSTVAGTDITCKIDAVQDLMPGELHHLTCWYNKGGKVVVDRTLHCDKNQVEDYIEVEDFYLGCKSR